MLYKINCKFFQKLKTYKMVQFLTRKWTSVNPFLKSLNGLASVFLNRGSSPWHMFRQLKMFLMTITFYWWQLESHGMFKNLSFFSMEIQTFFDSSEWLTRTFYTAFKTQPIKNSAFPSESGKFWVLHISKVKYRVLWIMW